MTEIIKKFVIAAYAAQGSSRALTLAVSFKTMGPVDKNKWRRRYGLFSLILHRSKYDRILIITSR